MGRRKVTWRSSAAAHARSFRKNKTTASVSDDSNMCIEISSDSDEDDEVTTWTGGVNHYITDCSDFSDWEEESVTGESDSDEDSEYPLSDTESEDEEGLLRLQRYMEHEIGLIRQAEFQQALKESAFDVLMAGKDKKEWKKAESNRALGYNKNSDRTRRRHDANKRKKEERDAELRSTNGAAMMRNFLTPKLSRPTELARQNLSTDAGHLPSLMRSEGTTIESDQIFTGYLSDISEDVPQPEDEGNVMVSSDSEEDSGNIGSKSIIPSFNIQQPPPLKRRRLDIPFRVARRKAKEERRAALEGGLRDIEKMIGSAKTKFVSGRQGLQARRARAIHSYLLMVVKNGRKGIEASQRAAEAQGFAENWGGRLVRHWVRKWIQSRTLPLSKRGQHIKAYTLLEDPSVRAELRSFLRANKWKMDPTKLVEYSEKTLIPAAAEKYTRRLVDEEMPRALMKYMEVDLFPRVQLKVKRGITLKTAQQFLRAEGFRFTDHKKGLYYDGHERPDVVDYRQNVFIPQMERYRNRIVEYQPENLEKEVVKTPPNYVERMIVLLPQDEMTAQANDGKKKSWVLDGEQPLRKKGAGRGIHQSDVICSTVGWVKEASQSLEYGKNYEGYWNGELFVKQLKEKIIPAFERAHGPGYQALIMVDNSQGHCAYAEDALLSSRMNFRPGGKQARLRDGWYIDPRTNQRVIQKMIFPPDHPTFPDQPKGMKGILIERGLWNSKLTMQCKDQCEVGATTCCARRILDFQPDFQGQNSLVVEVIESAGHLCIILPKFHCELNFIEYFWGAAKRYLREHCDYTFSTLQENMPIALASVNVLLIRKWQNRMLRWMDAYKDGLSAKEAQMRVKTFSSKRYKSHRRVPERVAAAFD